MIYKGRYQDLHLYEITEQDLILKSKATEEYSPGNVLVFADRKNIKLGTQIIRADDMESALEYLTEHNREIVSIDIGIGDNVADANVDANNDADTPHNKTHNRTPDNQDTAAFSNKNSKDLEEASCNASYNAEIDNLKNINAQLREEIALRDELLRDISDNLAIQRDHNEALKTALIDAQERLTVGELTQEEMLSDLENISAETQNIEITLEKTLEEKSELEAELAANITEYIELNFQNDDLRKRLDELTAKTEQTKNDAARSVSKELESELKLTPAASTASSRNTSVPLRTHPFTSSGSKNIHTLPSGKNIQVYHEFPKPRQRSKSATLALGVRTILRIIALVLLGILVVIAISVFATAHVNNSSLGEALNALLGSY